MVSHIFENSFHKPGLFKGKYLTTEKGNLILHTPIKTTSITNKILYLSSFSRCEKTSPNLLLPRIKKIVVDRFAVTCRALYQKLYELTLVQTVVVPRK